MRALYILCALLLMAMTTQVAAKSKSAKKAPSKQIEVMIDISKQQMQVYVDGYRKHKWKISTARKGYRTPTGDYKPLWTSRMHYSRKYDNSPMPYSIFFNGGYAIHGTNYVSRLGRPASHGCVRLHTSNARKLYKMVRRYGKNSMKIRVRHSVDSSLVGRAGSYGMNSLLAGPEWN